MARTPVLYTGKVDDDQTQRCLVSLRRYVENLERRLRKAEATKHLPRTAEIVLSANQGSISAGVIVAFDLISGRLYEDGLVKLAADGTVTLAPGHRYRIDFWSEATVTSSTGAMVIEFRVDGATFNADAGAPPRRMVTLGNTNTTTATDCSSGAVVYTPPTAVELTVEVTSASSVAQLDDGTRLLITEVAR